VAENDQEKTEEPTHKRLQDAVRKGQVAFSREVSSFMLLLVLALNILWFAPPMMRKATESFSRFLTSPHAIIADEGNLVELITETVSDVALILLLPILATVVAALLSSFLQNGIIFSGEPLIPKLEKISLIKGVKRLFSLRSLVEFIKGLIKISLIGIVAWLVIESKIVLLQELPNYDIDGIIYVISSLSFRIILGAVIIMFLIALLDFVYQRFEYIKSLRMTRQEIKDEFKQSEGDPHIKSKLRQIRMERARNRMMSAVPDADVIIRNPTHYAVALKYDQETMDAPIVVAVGQDNIALIIIKTAEENDVPLVSNPPLARALYGSCTLDQEIPLEHYQAVAEIISYVYRLKGKASA